MYRAVVQACRIGDKPVVVVVPLRIGERAWTKVVDRAKQLVEDFGRRRMWRLYPGTCVCTVNEGAYCSSPASSRACQDVTRRLWHLSDRS